MKIRYGFVSNSSSSSFLIIGTTDTRLIDKIIKAKELTREEIEQDMSFGMYESEELRFLGSESVDYVGTELVEEEMNLKPLITIKQEFAEKLKQKYNVVIPLEKIKMYYGEVCSG